MAQKTTVVHVDDLDGESAADETITFGLDGVSYEIDLSAEHAASLREDLATWLEHARRTGRRSAAARPAGRRVAADRQQATTVRDWARENGHDVSDRGRIPAAVQQAYDAATG